MLGLILWTVVLVAQSVAFMLARRAGNSGNYLYAAGASTLSHGVWFLAFYFTFDYLSQIHGGLLWYWAVAIGVHYTVVNMGGSLLGMWIARNIFEKGSRKVGHYADDATRITQLEDQVRLIARVLEAQIEEAKKDGAAAIRAKIEELRAGEAVGTETEVEA
jgi:hypothetical protein